MKFFKFLLLTSIMLVFMGSSLKESQSVSIQFLIGQVEYSKKSEIKRQRLGRRVKLYAGDKIYTKLESRVELKMFDGTIIKIGENSLFTINKMEKEEEKSSMSFGLSFGSLWAKFKKVFSSDSERKISTPTAVVAVRGTEFGVEVDPQTGKTDVKVKEGKVNVTNNRGTNSTDVGANQQTSMDQNGNSSGTQNYDSSNDPNAGLSNDGSGNNQNNGNNGNQNDSTNVTPTDSLGGNNNTGNNGSTNPNDSTNNNSNNNNSGNDNNNSGGNDNGNTNTNPPADTYKPQITLKKNVNGRYTKERTYVVTGSIFDQTDSDEIFVFVNGESVTKIQKQGSFRHNINLLEGDNSIVVSAQDKAGNVSTETQELFLDSNEPKVQISGGIHPIALGLSVGELPPFPPKFSSFKRSVRGFVNDPEPSSGIKRVLINGQEVPLKSDNSFSKDIRITIEQYKQLKSSNQPYVLRVEVEDLAGNIYRDQSIRIKVR